MRVLIVSSGLAALLAFHNAVTRYGYALGRERVVPARFSAVHPRHRSPYVSSVAQSLFAVVAVAAFALAGSDPIVEMAAWTASTGTLGVVAMQLLTAVSVAAFFRRSALAGWRSASAFGAAGAVLLAVAIYLVIDHIDLATLTTDTVVNAVVIALPVAVFALGLALAAWLRAARPSVYAGLGSTDMDEQLEPAPSAR
jgi:amino acid transporter